MIVAPFYLSFIENQKVSKDKDTSFIQAIMLSDWKLAKAKEVKPIKRTKGYQYGSIKSIKQKML